MTQEIKTEIYAIGKFILSRIETLNVESIIQLEYDGKTVFKEEVGQKWEDQQQHFIPTLKKTINECSAFNEINEPKGWIITPVHDYWWDFFYSDGECQCQIWRQKTVKRKKWLGLVSYDYEGFFVHLEPYENFAQAAAYVERAMNFLERVSK